MTTRTVNIALVEAVPQVRTVVFKPRLSSLDDGTVLLRQKYECTTNGSGVGSIALPVKAAGSIRYDFEIPKVGGKDIGYFVIAAGSAVTLDALIAAGGEITDSILDYGDAHWGGGGGDVATDEIFNAKGDLPVGTGSDTAARLAAGANDSFLVPDSAQTTGLKWIAPSAAKTLLNLAGNNLGDQWADRINIRQALGSPIKAETWPMERLATTFSLTDNRMDLQAVWLPIAATITGVKWWQAVQGNYTADQNNKVGLFTYNGAGTLTLVASSTNDGNIWKGGSNTFQSKAFSSTYPAAPGLYFIGLLYNHNGQTTAPQLVAGNSAYLSQGGSVDYTNNAKAIGFVTGLNDLPSSQAMSGVGVLGIPVYLALY